MPKQNIFILGLLLTFICASSQSITGQWKTIGDETGDEKSIVEIYEFSGQVYGKIIEILNPKKKDSKCSKCEGDNKNKPVLGMLIMDGLTKGDDVYDDENILNSSNGKVYKCRPNLGEDPNGLQVRGDIAFFYKTQYWQGISR